MTIIIIRLNSSLSSSPSLPVAQLLDSEVVNGNDDALIK